MRVPFVVYGVLYAVFEMVGYQIEQVGWADVSGLDVATAVTDALLTVAVCAAALLAVDLGRKRWGPAVTAWLAERTHVVEAEIWDDAPVRTYAWRPQPLAVTAERVEEPRKKAWTGNPYVFGGHRFPKDDGTLL
ncbi:hypothetical protein [Blastococcus litoris]|uniref:hypothetical protein n=1 Tax=Blastococcus litoris TaxID=2171622 RepID=UPI0013DECEC0|nr:hypothetical protein [Blastococcus litoris]